VTPRRDINRNFPGGKTNRDSKRKKKRSRKAIKKWLVTLREELGEGVSHPLDRDLGSYLLKTKTGPSPGERGKTFRGHLRRERSLKKGGGRAGSGNVT